MGDAIQVFEAIQEFIHVTSIVALCVIVFAAFAGMIKPSILCRVYQEFSQRKFIAGSAVFACMLLGTIFIATYPVNRTVYESNHGEQNTAHEIPVSGINDEPVSKLPEQKPAEPKPTEGTPAQQTPTNAQEPASHPEVAATPAAEPQENVQRPNETAKQQDRTCDGPGVQISSFRLLVCIP